MSIVIEQILLLLAFISIGYLLSKLKVIKSNQSQILSGLCVYFFLPCKVFNSFSGSFTLEYISTKYPLTIAGVVIVILLALVSIPISRALTKDSYIRKVYHYSLATSNYGYMGYALAEGIFGSGMLLDVIVYGLPLSVYINTVGYTTLTNTKTSLKKLISPVNIATVLGAVVGLTGFEIPDLLGSLLSKAGSCLSPVSMLLAGIVISEYKLKDLVNQWQVYVVSLLRLVVIPLTVSAILYLLGLQQVVLPALIVLAMPCGLNTIVFPRLVGQDCKPGAALAFITSLMCCITIPLCLLIFGNLSA